MEDNSVLWVGEVEHLEMEDGTEVPVLVLSDGSRVELWPEGVSAPDCRYVLAWEAILEALAEFNRTAHA